MYDLYFYTQTGTRVATWVSQLLQSIHKIEHTEINLPSKYSTQQS